MPAQPKPQGFPSPLILLALPLALAAWLDAAESPAGALPPRRKLALVIGIDQYQHVRPLQNAVSDARAVGRALRENYGFEVREVLDRQATRSGIIQAIRTLVSGLQDGDSVVIYYAGHGWADDVLKEGYWIPAEAKEQSEYVANAELHKVIRAMEKAQHVLLIADSCFSGSFLARSDDRTLVVRPKEATAEQVGGFFKRLDNRKSRLVLTSGANEPVPDGGREGHSLFGYYVLRALDAPDDPVFTAAELALRVQKVVAQNSPQTPLSGSLRDAGHEDGQMVFLRGGTPVPTPTPPERPAFKVYSAWPFDAAEARRRQEETARALGVKVEEDVDLGGGAKLTLVLVPAGEFMMGSAETWDELARIYGRAWKPSVQESSAEYPQHRVRITKPFWIGKSKVTEKQWKAVVGHNDGLPSEGPNYPVVCVSWHAAQDFLQRLNDRVTGGRFALPTEAQWEYACRAGSAARFSFGNDGASLRRYANTDEAKVAPVGRFLANAFGLHDMHGCPLDWCNDWYGPYGAGALTDPTGPVNGKSRVARGRTFFGDFGDYRCASRCSPEPDNSLPTSGFRVVRFAAGL